MAIDDSFTFIEENKHISYQLDLSALFLSFNSMVERTSLLHPDIHPRECPRHPRRSHTLSLHRMC